MDDNLAGFLSHCNNRKANLSNPRILRNIRKGSFVWLAASTQTIKLLTSCFDSLLRADQRSSVVAFSARNTQCSAKLPDELGAYDMHEP
jgi:hypothetical protein